MGRNVPPLGLGDLKIARMGLTELRVGQNRSFADLISMVGSVITSKMIIVNHNCFDTFIPNKG